MASHTIRIELRDPTANTLIEVLYTMLENGFSRSVVCEKGRTFALPANEYVYVGAENIRSLTDRVATLVNVISKVPWCWSRSRQSVAGQDSGEWI